MDFYIIPLGNSVIAVNGDENVDLETPNFARKPPGRHSLKLKQFCKVHVVRHNLLYIFLKVHLIFICSITAKKNAHFPHDLGF